LSKLRDIAKPRGENPLEETTFGSIFGLLKIDETTKNLLFPLQYDAHFLYHCLKHLNQVLLFQKFNEYWRNFCF
jgi:hypothetical protein